MAFCLTRCLETLYASEFLRQRWFFCQGILLRHWASGFFRASFAWPGRCVSVRPSNLVIRSYTVAGILCGFGVAGWVLLSPRRIATLVGSYVVIFLVGDLLVSRITEAHRPIRSYYPAAFRFGGDCPINYIRIIGYNCFRNARQRPNCRYPRYDSIDPGRLMALMDLAADPRNQPNMYAMTQVFWPRIEFGRDGIKLPPVLDMLSVRYVIFRGTPRPPIRPALQGNDYWALINHAALPRAFIPRRVEMVTDDYERLGKLASAQFDPHAVAYVESFVSLPDECRGEAEISSEIPTRVTYP